MNSALAIDGAKPVRLSILAVVVIAHAVLGMLLVTFRFSQALPEDRSPIVVRVIELPNIPPPPPPELKPEVKQAPPPAPPVMAPTSPVAPLPLPQAPVSPIAPIAPVAASPPPPEPVTHTTRVGRPIFKDIPPFPVTSWNRKEHGTVVLRVIVGFSGLVEEISVVESSGFARLDKSALEAVRKWRWSPSEYEGAPIRGLTNVRYTFPRPS